MNQFRGEKGLEYFVKVVDDKEVGDPSRGTFRINEIYTDPGKHKLEIIAYFVEGSYWDVYQDAFTGVIGCEFEAGNFYTIAPNENGSPIGKSLMNWLPIVKMGQVVTGHGMQKNKELKLACIEHTKRPKNPKMEEILRKNFVKSELLYGSDKSL